MVAADLLTVGQAVYTIMGANVGTSITSTLVAFGNVGTPSEFRCAMEAAVLVAAFNWCTILVLMPLEIIFDMMEKLTGAIVAGIDESATGSTDSFDPIAAVTDPLQEYIIKINKDGLGDTNYTGSFVKVPSSSKNSRFRPILRDFSNFSIIFSNLRIP